MKDLYFKVGNAYVNIMWSSNDSFNPRSTGVIGIYVYDSNGEEHPNIEGGEMDVYDNKSLEDHIPDVLDFIGFSANEDVEMMSEEKFPVGF